jgi:hypothetical protein
MKAIRREWLNYSQMELWRRRIKIMVHRVREGKRRERSAGVYVPIQMSARSDGWEVTVHISYQLGLEIRDFRNTEKLHASLDFST